MADQALLEVARSTDGFSTLLEHMRAAPAICDHDVQRLRHVFYREGRIDRRRAAEVFHANRIVSVKSDGWVEFYLEALTDFFLDRDRGGFLFPADAKTVLLGWLGHDEAMVDIAERRLVTRILLRASETSEPFERRVLDAVKLSLLNGQGRWLGGEASEAGVIDAQDMHLIQKLIRRDAPGRRAHVSRASLDFLFDLGRLAAGFSDPQAFRDLLVETAASHMLDRSQTDDSTSPSLNVETSAYVMDRVRIAYAADRAARLQHDILQAVQIHRAKPI